MKSRISKAKNNKKDEFYTQLSDYKDLEKFFKKIDKIWQQEFGKECKEFCPMCAQCKFALIYNKFKQDIFDEVLK